MPRPSTGARDRIVESTLNLLRQGGLSAAGLNEIVTHAQAPKGSLYHYFPGGKTELVAAALLAYSDQIDTLLRDVLETSVPIDKRVRALFRSIEGRMAASGYAQSCAVGAVVLDLPAEEDGLRKICHAILKRWAETARQQMPEFPEALRMPLARTLVTLLEGAQLLARAERGGRPLREAAEAFLAITNRS